MLSYYTDPMRDQLETTLITISDDRRRLVLADTVFYPEGGGQPGDRGTITPTGGSEADVAVVDTQKREDGTVEHILARPAPADLSPGTAVRASLDWRLRWEYMQQHTGQHVLSGALARIADAPTVSVHQGADVTTIEVNRESIADRHLEAVEEAANAVIRDNRAVTTTWVDSSELPNYPLRRPTDRTGRVRLVEIEDFDLVACGGVHLPRTGMLNVVHLSSVERIRGRLRLAFRIGDRAITHYRDLDAVAQESARLFSAHPDDLVARITTAQEETKELNRRVRLRAQRIAALELERATDASDASAGSDHRDATTPVVLHYTGEDDDVIKALGEVASEDPRRRVCVLNRTDAGLQWTIVVGTEYAFPAEEIRTAVLAPLGAKGGGKPPLWRGIVRDPAPDTADRFTELVRTVLSGTPRRQ